MSKTLQVYTREEVGKHNKPDDAWVIIREKVYNVTNFAPLHPGGEVLLLEYAGKDCTKDFEGLHRNEVLVKYSSKLLLGKIEGSSDYDETTGFESMSEIPYAEIPFYQGFKSPYYNDSHLRYAKALREFYSKEVYAIAQESELQEKAPTKEMFKKLGDFGILATTLGPYPEYLKMAPNGLPGGVSPEEFDYFHDAIGGRERGRMFCPGFEDGIQSGITIGLPNLVNYGTPWMKKEIVPKIIRGEEVICLAITEAFGGSDVASLRTTAKKDPTGQFYIVNGTKKWITNATFADWFVTAVRTGGPGQGGISFLLIPRIDGVSTKVIKTSYSSAAGTGYITFENVRVPVDHLLGKENQGFKLVMANFNHERWGIAAGTLGKTRYIVEECFKWMNQREAFGKKLSTQPVLMEKMAEAVSLLEACEAWFSEITYQMNNMSKAEQNLRLGGQIALLKFVCTNTADKIADHAVQIFGGRGITKGAMGGKVEIFQRTNKFAAVYGGSREIMANLGIKTALRSFPANAKL